MGNLGIEPRTYRLKADYSTIELVALQVQFYYNSKRLFFTNLKKGKNFFIQKNTLKKRECNK